MCWGWKEVRVEIGYKKQGPAPNICWPQFTTSSGISHVFTFLSLLLLHRFNPDTKASIFKMNPVVTRILNSMMHSLNNSTGPILEEVNCLSKWQKKILSHLQRGIWALNSLLIHISWASSASFLSQIHTAHCLMEQWQMEKANTVNNEKKFFLKPWTLRIQNYEAGKQITWM